MPSIREFGSTSTVDIRTWIYRELGILKLTGFQAGMAAMYHRYILHASEGEEDELTVEERVAATVRRIGEDGVKKLREAHGKLPPHTLREQQVKRGRKGR